MNSINRNCASSCREQNHASYGECLRSQGIKVAYANSASGWDATRQRNFDRTNAAYRQAVADGLQPQGVEMSKIRQAYEGAAARPSQNEVI